MGYYYLLGFPQQYTLRKDYFKSYSFTAKRESFLILSLRIISRIISMPLFKIYYLFSATEINSIIRLFMENMIK